MQATMQRLRIAATAVAIFAYTPAVAESLLPVGTVIMCERGGSVGFNWRDGKYVAATFTPEEHLFRKVLPVEDCVEKGSREFDEDNEMVRAFSVLVTDVLKI